MTKDIFRFQGVSVCVSVLTLSSISIERYYAICRPLSFKATPKRAKYMITLTWVVSFLIMIPEAISMTIHRFFPQDFSVALTSCGPGWAFEYQAAFHIVIMTTMYFIPLALIFWAYTKIAQALWKSELPSSTGP